MVDGSRAESGFGTSWAMSAHPPSLEYVTLGPKHRMMPLESLSVELFRLLRDPKLALSERLRARVEKLLASAWLPENTDGSADTSRISTPQPISPAMSSDYGEQVLHGHRSPGFPGFDV